MNDLGILWSLCLPCSDVLSWTSSLKMPCLFWSCHLSLLDYDPCINYNTLNDSWRNIRSYGYIYGSSANYDDTGVNWDGWYRLFLNGLSAQMPEWCVSYLTCGGFSSLWLAGSHPRLEDGVVTRDIYGSYFEQCSYYRSDPIQVKACPGNYYVYKIKRPKVLIPAPAYCAGTVILLHLYMLIMN